MKGEVGGSEPSPPHINSEALSTPYAVHINDFSRRSHPMKKFFQ